MILHQVLERLKVATRAFEHAISAEDDEDLTIMLMAISGETAEWLIRYREHINLLEQDDGKERPNTDTD